MQAQGLAWPIGGAEVILKAVHEHGTALAPYSAGATDLLVQLTVTVSESELCLVSGLLLPLSKLLA